MAYKAFPNITTAYRPNYRRNEDRYYGGGNHAAVETIVRGPLHLYPNEAVKDAVDTALETTAERGRRFVVPDTPIQTGLLRSRWYTKPIRWNEWRLSNDIFYAPFQERRAMMLRRNLPAIQRALDEELNRELPKHLNG